MIHWDTVSNICACFFPYLFFLYIIYISSKIWTIVNDGSHGPPARSGHSAVYFDGKMFIFGGLTMHTQRYYLLLLLHFLLLLILYYVERLTILGNLTLQAISGVLFL